MRHGADEDDGRRGTPKLLHAKTARFASLVAKAGIPEVYLPLVDPKTDKSFMRAVRENRVLSIRQEPTSKRTDFGIVGFDERPHTTLLVFSKPLRGPSGTRVVGIKYDVIGNATISSGRGHIQPPKRRRRQDHRSSRPPIRSSAKPAALPRPEKPNRRAVQTRQFNVRVRVTTVTEKELTVSATTKAGARKQAAAQTEGETVRVVAVRQL